MLESDGTTLCVIGAGPRGLSVVERVCANAAVTGQRTVLHLVDPYLRLGSRVWRVNQPPMLLMNTVASQVTMFTDESVTCEGPVSRGPSLYEWAKLLERLEPFVPYPPHVYEEAARLGPDSYPTRALYGRYLGWVFDRLVRTVPEHIAIEPHGTPAVAVRDEAGGTQTVTLANGTRLTDLDAVVLALGHVDMPLTGPEQELDAFAARHGLGYIPPGNPSEAPLDRIAPGERVALRGMGLNFFDHMALLTTGRGGSFVRERGTLRYRPSGDEPVLVAGSRRGVPYHARGENQKGATGRHHPLFLTEQVIARLRARRAAGEPVEFARDVWPLVDLEVRAVYYHALIAQERGRYDADVFLGEYVAAVGADGAADPGGRTAFGAALAGLSDAGGVKDPGAVTDPGGFAAVAAKAGGGEAGSEAERRLLRRFGVADAWRWDWERVSRPYGDREFADPADFHDWLLGHLREDVREAHRGNVRGPLKAALDVMRDLRNEVRLVVDHSGITGGSYRKDLESWYTPLNAYVSIGPPLARIEEMAALIEAGVLHVVGPGMTVSPSAEGKAFVVSSPRVPGSEQEVSTLVEARLPQVDVRTTGDPLLRDLMTQGAARAYAIAGRTRDGDSHRTGGLAVTQKPYRLVEWSGTVHPRRFAFGIPTESVHWATAAGIRPGSDSVILGDADAIARACLAAGPAVRLARPVATVEGD
ncbi:FAD/NAD(P)-binding protein [Streptomyces adustus]|uniref:FAD/NAD(P)-binding protein n=1 Tax=Streptomyces adustus TaxID=1609272 RepID=UPI0037156705